MRSCFSGYWRFFASSPGIITPGAYFFVPKGTPCLNDFHYFGSEDWRHGDDEEVVGLPPPVKIGNDKSLGWAWYNGAGPALLPPARTVGNPADFQLPQVFNPSFHANLLGGIDKRCYVPAAPCYVSDLFFFATNNCAWMLVCAGMIKKVDNFDKIPLTAFLTTLLGPGTQIDFDDGDVDNPPTAIVQTARNNLIIFGGTAGNAQLLRQIRAAVAGATQYGTIKTLSFWWNRATRIIDLMNTLGVDYDKRTYLVGYSYGAATACVLWWRLFDADDTRQFRMTTVGCPKPGDPVLLANLNTLLVATHAVNSNDIVPRIPPPQSFAVTLQLLFPFLPLPWYDQWTPHKEYLQIQAGGNFTYGPLVGASLVEYVAFVAGTLVRGDLNPVANHFLDNYIRNLALHCPDPEAPFDGDCYEILFGVRSFGPGGLVFNGEGILAPPSGVASILLDGAGELVFADAAEGVVLDGAGKLAIADAGEGVVLDGAGELAFAAESLGVVLGGGGAFSPGATCSGAAPLTLGASYSGTIANGQQQWFAVPITSGVQYHVRFTVAMIDTSICNVKSGGSCSSLTLRFIDTSVNPCHTYTPGSNENLYMQVQGFDPGTISYTLIVDTGSC